jgi:hypothetical protein
VLQLLQVLQLLLVLTFVYQKKPEEMENQNTLVKCLPPDSIEGTSTRIPKCLNHVAIALGFYRTESTD